MKHQFLAIALAAGLVAGSAQAVTLDSVSGVATVTPFSAGSLLAFDLDFASLGSATLNFRVEAADVGNTLSFNALVRNLSGLGFDGAALAITGATFSAPGTFGTDGFQAITASGSTAQGGWAVFSPALTTDFYIGKPLETSPGTDWAISLGGAQAGDTFSVTVSAVPEPETYALMLAGLAFVGALARRARRNG